MGNSVRELWPGDKLFHTEFFRNLLLKWCYTKRFATTIFSPTQRCNIVATLFWMVTSLFQHWSAALRLKSSLRIVPCNITFTYDVVLYFIEEKKVRKNSLAPVWTSFREPNMVLLNNLKKIISWYIRTGNVVEICIWIRCIFKGRSHSCAPRLVNHNWSYQQVSCYPCVEAFFYRFWYSSLVKFSKLFGRRT